MQNQSENSPFASLIGNLAKDFLMSQVARSGMPERQPANIFPIPFAGATTGTSMNPPMTNAFDFSDDDEEMPPLETAGPSSAAPTNRCASPTIIPGNFTLPFVRSNDQTGSVYFIMPGIASKEAINLTYRLDDRIDHLGRRALVVVAKGDFCDGDTVIRRYSYQYTLPASITSENLSAKYETGVLVVTYVIPQPTEPTPISIL